MERKLRLAERLHNAHQAMEAMYDRELASLGITPRQYTVLDVIARNEDASQTTCVNATRIDRSTMSDIVSRLVDHGFVMRRRSRRDARANVLALTLKGQRTYDAASEIVDNIEAKIEGAGRINKLSLRGGLDVIAQQFRPLEAAE